MVKKFSNRLLNESSPYLLQHAYNPVDWYTWGEEAIERAKAENKIILLSIGYSACHWCHVMEKESFENESVALFMNENFINIKVDREERPDLDHIYMDAVQAISGSGGWPLNVFLTPETKPIYGGTYFPPVKAFNRSSWTDVLKSIQNAWKEKETEIRAQAQNLTAHLNQSNDLGFLKEGYSVNAENEHFSKEDADNIFAQIMGSADTVWGGFGKAPKFPQTFVIQYLMHYHFFTGSQTALNQALLSIDKMLQGGIYDQVGGGLARYSTDEEWLAPHFEKMLYDNALFIRILCDAFQLTKKDDYAKAIRKTIAFVERELMDKDGGFYAALDADSEGEEGKYYVWDKNEIDDLLGEDSAVFCEYFDISAAGNWSADQGRDKKNILRILTQRDLFIKEQNLSLIEFENKIGRSLEILFLARARKPRPGTDDKILLNWNALMITSLCCASGVLNEKRYADLAENSFNIILNKFNTGANGYSLKHSFKGTKAKHPAFLDDYAYLIQSCIALQELTSNTRYLKIARELTHQVIGDFFDERHGFFYYSSKDQKDIIFRNKEVHDGAIPSGNSVMAGNLFYLAKIFDNTDWQRLAWNIAGALKTAIMKYPASFGNWASVVLMQVYGVNEVVISGPEHKQICSELLIHYLPNKVLQSSHSANNEYPLLLGKNNAFETLIYLCKDYICGPPLKTIEELLAMWKTAERVPK